MTVKMTMREYEELVRKAEWYEDIKAEIKRCVAQEWDDECSLIVDSEQVKKLLFGYAANDCELDGYSPDTIKWEVR